jgi:hypothetical protein
MPLPFRQDETGTQSLSTKKKLLKRAQTEEALLQQNLTSLLLTQTQRDHKRHKSARRSTASGRNA